jgi:endothelin-converting enzyme
MSPAEANALTPQINLSSIITSLSPAGFEAERIVVTSPKYMKDLQTTILETPGSVMAIYFVWKVIQEFAPYIEAGALKSYKRFNNEVQGKVNCDKIAQNYASADCIGPRIDHRTLEDLCKPRR